jgi:urease accessory protein
VALKHRWGRAVRSKPGLSVASGLAAAVASLLVTTPALAHAVDGIDGDFFAGLRHPLTGADHLLAMVSVGIWGAELGLPAIWLLPIAFPLMMAVGAIFGIIGVPLPGTELLIALSVTILGAMVALAQRLPLWAAALIIGVFALAHGHAHGVELAVAADALAFCIGFVLATGFLHAVGIVVGLSTRWPSGFFVIRICGALVTAAGCYFIYRNVEA